METNQQPQIPPDRHLLRQGNPPPVEHIYGGPAGDVITLTAEETRLMLIGVCVTDAVSKCPVPFRLLRRRASSSQG